MYILIITCLCNLRTRVFRLCHATPWEKKQKLMSLTRFRLADDISLKLRTRDVTSGFENPFFPDVHQDATNERRRKAHVTSGRKKYMDRKIVIVLFIQQTVNFSFYAQSFS